MSESLSEPMPTHSEGCGAYLAAKGHECDCDITSRLRKYAECLSAEVARLGKDAQRVDAAIENCRTKNGKRSCDCETCDCSNSGDTYSVGSWDGADWVLNEINAALAEGRKEKL